MKVLTYILGIALVVVGFFVGSLYLLGLSPLDLKANIEVGTGMGAKLGCSAKYVSGLNEQQIANDLASYTPATEALSVTFDDDAKSVSVSLFGLGAVSASYRPGVGCTLDIGDAKTLDQLVLPKKQAAGSLWPLGELVPPPSADLQDVLQEVMARDNSQGLDSRALVVVHKGQLLGELYAPGYHAQTPLLGWSMGKSLTAVMLGRMVAQGKISLSEQALFKPWESDARRDISVENLLQMSSGLNFSEVYAPGSDATKMLFTAPSASGVALASTSTHPPGAHFAYSSGTTNLLMRLMHDRLGGSQALLDFLHQEILAPLGMHNTVVEFDPSGIFVGSSYVYASARDWARLGQLMLAGQLNGQQLLSPDWVAAAAAPNKSNNDTRYGYQFWLNGTQPNLRWPQLPADAFAMSGNRAQSVMIIPSADTVIVRLGWSSGSYPLGQNFAQLLEGLDVI